MLSLLKRTGWFTGLSSKFLSCKTAKLLILAGTDRLDRELLIGQMQGEPFPSANRGRSCQDCEVDDSFPRVQGSISLKFTQKQDIAYMRYAPPCSIRVSSLKTRSVENVELTSPLDRSQDLPDRTADTLLNFWERNDRVDVLKGVKKVGEM